MRFQTGTLFASLMFTALLASCASLPKDELPSIATNPALRPTREIASTRDIATYIPRADELRLDIRRFEERIRGTQQDILDLEKVRLEIRRALSDYRRLYPDTSTEPEQDVLRLEETLQPVFGFFIGNLRPDKAGCRRIVDEILRRPVTVDTDLAVRLTEKLCGLPPSGSL